VNPVVPAVPAVPVVPAGFTLRRAAEHPRVPWANGGGTTREVIAMPEVGMNGLQDNVAAAPWRWRLSIADVDTDGPFSVLPGVQRTIAMLHGDGFVLTVGDAEPVRIDAAFRPFRFDGAESTSCELIRGGVIDLNLMERGTVRMLDLRFEVVSADGCFEATDVVAVVVVAGAADVSAGPASGLAGTGPVVLQQLDALISASPGGAAISVRSTVRQCVVALVAVAAA
jgi:uncharacterized protein